MINLKTVEEMHSNGLISDEAVAAFKQASLNTAAGPTHYVVNDDDDILNVGDSGEFTFKQAKRALRERLTERAAEQKAVWKETLEAIKALPGLRKAEVDQYEVVEADVQEVEEVVEHSAI